MKRFLIVLLIGAILCIIASCSSPNTSTNTAANSQSSSKSTKVETPKKQKEPKQVYGKDKPLPDYNDLVNNPSLYKDGPFLIEGYLYDAEYENGNDAGHFLNVWITYDYDKSQGKYYMNSKDKKANPVKINHFPREVFQSGSETGTDYAHIQVSCGLMYVDTDKVPVFFYGSGEVY